MSRLVLLALVLSLCSVGNAQSVTTWNSTSNGDWSNAANWNNGVPTATSTAILPFSVTVTISGTTAVTVANLTILAGSLIVNPSFTAQSFQTGLSSHIDVSFAGSLSVAQSFSWSSFAGVITLNGNASFGGVVSFSSPSSIAGTGSLSVSGAISVTSNVTCGVSFTSTSSLSLSGQGLLTLSDPEGSSIGGTLTLNTSTSVVVTAGTHTWTAQMYGTSGSLSLLGGSVQFSTGYVEPSISINGANVFFWQAITLRSLSLDYGYASFSHSSTVENLLVTADNDTFSQLTVASNNQLSISDSLTWIDQGPLLNGNFSILNSASANFSASSLIGGTYSLYNYGLMFANPTVASNNEFSITGTLYNFGTFQWAPESEDFYIAQGASFVNQGTFNATLIGFHFIDGAGTFTNAGTFSASTNLPKTVQVTLLLGTFNNNGVVSLQSTTLTVLSPGTSSGRFSGDAGSQVQFGLGSVTLESPCTVDAGLAVLFSGASVTVSTGNFLSSAWTQNQGQVTFTNAYTSTGSVTVEAGVLVVPTGSAFNTLIIEAQALLNVAGSINIANFELYSGNVSAVGTTAATLNLLASGSSEISPIASEGGSFLTNVTLVNQGTLAYIPNGMCDVNLVGSQIVNAAGGQLQVVSPSTDASAVCGDAWSSLSNSGTFQILNQSALHFLLNSNFAAGSLTIGGSSSVAFAGTNTYANSQITVNAGSTIAFGAGTHSVTGGFTLDCLGTASFSASWTVTGSNTFSIVNLVQSAGAVSFPAGFTGNGNVALSGGTLSVGSLALSTLTVSGGTLSLVSPTGTLYIQNALTWTGGSITGNSTSINLMSTANSTIDNVGNSDTSGVALTSATLQNAGTLTLYTGYGLTVGSSGNLVNNGTFTVAGNGTDAYVRKGDNAGTLTNNGKIVVPSGKVLHMCVSVAVAGTQDVSGCLDTSCDSTQCAGESEDNTVYIVVGVIGGILVVGLAVGIIVWVVKRRRAHAEVNETSALLSSGKPVTSSLL